MEERLNALIARINASALSDTEKSQLYMAISGGFQASIWPVLLKFVSEQELDSLLAEIDEKKKLERYSQLIGDAMEKGTALSEIDETMNKLLDEVESAMKEENL